MTISIPALRQKVSKSILSAHYYALIPLKLSIFGSNGEEFCTQTSNRQYPLDDRWSYGDMHYYIDLPDNLAEGVYKIKMADTVHQGRAGDASNDDAAVVHTQAVILAVSAHLLVEQQLDHRFLAAGDINATFFQLISEQFFDTAVATPLEQFAGLDGNDAAQLGETVLDIHLLGGGEDVIVVARVAVAETINRLIVTVHVVAVGVGLVVTPLSGFVERRAVDVHCYGMSHVAAHHHMSASGHVALVNDSTTHYHFHHERVTRSHHPSGSRT